jgi:hypothetical protein
MIRSAMSSESSESVLEQIWKTSPDEREKLRPYVERAKSYRNECGCEMGGVFFTGAVVIVILDLFLIHGISGGGWLTGALRGSAFVFCASLLGKAIGIGVARLRLALMYKELRHQYRIVSR